MSDESWDRLPDARIRMREGGVELLTKALDEKGFVLIGGVTIRRTEDGIYLEIPTNVSKGGGIVFLGLDVLIPVPPAAL